MEGDGFGCIVLGAGGEGRARFVEEHAVNRAVALVVRGDIVGGDRKVAESSIADLGEVRADRELVGRALLDSLVVVAESTVAYYHSVGSSVNTNFGMCAFIYPVSP